MSRVKVINNVIELIFTADGHLPHILDKSSEIETGHQTAI